MKKRFRVSHVSEHGVWQKVRVFQRLRSQHRSSLKIKMTSWWASSFERRARNPQSCSFGIHEFHPPWKSFPSISVAQRMCIFAYKWNNKVIEWWMERPRARTLQSMRARVILGIWISGGSMMRNWNPWGRYKKTLVDEGHVRLVDGIW